MSASLPSSSEVGTMMNHILKTNSMTRSISILIVLILLGTGLEAQAQSRVGTTAATFLTLGAGARGTSLGHAYTSIATGPDALFWNPGGAALAYNKRHRGGVMFSNNNWLAGISYNAFGVVVPITSTGVLGLSLATVDYGRMDVRSVSNPEGTGETFGAADLSLGLTYAMQLTPSFYFGGSTKYVHQSIRDMSAATVAFDFGFVLVTDYLNGAQIAASIMNFGGKMQMDGINAETTIDLDAKNTGSTESIPARIRMDKWDLPIAFKLGVGVPVISTTNVELMLLADANQTNDNNLNSDLGAQFKYFTRNMAFNTRVGYKDANLDNVDSHLSYGAGLEVELAGARFGFDFAYIPFDLLDDTRTFDFRIYF
jgi:hypothetical protein